MDLLRTLIAQLTPVHIVVVGFVVAVFILKFFSDRWSKKWKGRNPYKILGIPTKATREQIRDAYVKGLHDLRTSLSPTHPNHQRLIDLADAYSVLSNPLKRWLYDEALPSEEPMPDPEKVAEGYLKKELSDPSLHPVAGIMLLIPGVLAIIFGMLIILISLFTIREGVMNSLKGAVLGMGVLLLGLFVATYGLGRLAGKPYASGMTWVFQVLKMMARFRK